MCECVFERLQDRVKSIRERQRKGDWVKSGQERTRRENQKEGNEKGGGKKRNEVECKEKRRKEKEEGNAKWIR